MEVMLKLLRFSDETGAHSWGASRANSKNQELQLALSVAYFGGKNSQESTEFLDGDTRLTRRLFIEAAAVIQCTAFTALYQQCSFRKMVTVGN